MQTQHYVPQALKGSPNWVIWRLEANSKNPDRLAKMPYSPPLLLQDKPKTIDGRYRARANEPDTWGTIEQAREAFKLYHNSESIRGAGFEFGNSDFLFLDLDHCVNNGTPNKLAAEFLDVLQGTYCELSQSATGLHFILKGRIPYQHAKRTTAIEFYPTAHYCALTFNAVYPCEPTSVNTEAIDLLRRHGFDFQKEHEEKEAQEQKRRSTPLLRSNQGDGLTDEDVIYHVRKGHCGSLYDSGQGNEASHSEADQKLCNCLAFWCDCDPEKMDRIFRSSALYREKWNRTDYSAGTIQKAIDWCEFTYSEWLQQKRDKKLSYWSF